MQTQNTQENQQLLLEERYVIRVNFNGKFRNNVVFVIALLTSKQCLQESFVQKDIGEERSSKGPTNVTNALFVGSTAELAKLLKQQKAEE